MKTEIKVHMMHECGESFKDIAKAIGGMSAYDAALMYTKVESLREKAKNKENNEEGLKPLKTGVSTSSLPTEVASFQSDARVLPLKVWSQQWRP